MTYGVKMASKWGMLRQGVTGSPGSAPRGDGVSGRSPAKSDVPSRSASKSPAMGKVKITRERSKSDSDPPNSPTMKTSKWNAFRSGATGKSIRKEPAPEENVHLPAKTSKWALLKMSSAGSSEGVPAEDCNPEQTQLNDASLGNIKVSKWSNLKLRSSQTASSTGSVVSSTVSSPPGVHRVQRESRPVYHRQKTLPVHAPDGAAPKMSFRALVKSMTNLPDIEVTTPPPVETANSQIINTSKQNIIAESKPSPSPGFKRKALPSFLLPKERPPPNDNQTSGQASDVDNYSNVSMLQVDDEMKRKLRQETDVSMVTLTQPTESRS